MEWDPAMVFLTYLDPRAPFSLPLFPSSSSVSEEEIHRRSSILSRGRGVNIFGVYSTFEAKEKEEESSAELEIGRTSSVPSSVKDAVAAVSRDGGREGGRELGDRRQTAAAGGQSGS